ncbi:MAG: hypothetical protein HY293_07480 [Planctomycetes bacterium]|nr:hypothetical protein [Planctomycetota bacterium]
MGKEIVYCGGCGKSLREDDFSRGKAHQVDHRPFCTDCKAAPSQHQTSARLAAQTKSSGGRFAPAAAPSTRRRRAEESSKTPLLIGAALVAAALVALLVMALGSGDRASSLPPPDPTPPPPRPAGGAAAPKPPRPSPAETDRAAAAIRDLEAFSIASDNAVAILQRCEEVRPVVRGTSLEPRLKDIEERAKETRRTRQLAASLEEVSKLRAFDPQHERKEEVLRLLRATLAIAGPRRAEVEEIIRAYEKESPANVTRPPPPPAAGGPLLGPFDCDASGCINHWLVLGPFGNRAHREGLYDNDLLTSEDTYVPAAGLDVSTREGGRVRWTAVVVSDGKLLFRTIDALGLASKPAAPAIAYAACWVTAERDMEIKFRIQGETGYYLKLDGKRLRNHSPGQPFSGPEDVFNVKLTQGPHLLLFKVATIGEPFGVRLRLASLAGPPAPGLKIWNQPPVTRKTLFAASFNAGLDGFQNGELVEGGVDGTKALSVSKDAAWVENFLNQPITSETTIRFKVKPLIDLPSFQVMMWSAKTRLNYWYHLKNLKKGEWTPVELRLSALRGGYKMDGPSVEGEQPVSLRFYFEETVPGSRALVDDLEILE